MKLKAIINWPDHSQKPLMNEFDLNDVQGGTMDLESDSINVRLDDGNVYSAVYSSIEDANRNTDISDHIKDENKAMFSLNSQSLESLPANFVEDLSLNKRKRQKEEIFEVLKLAGHKLNIDQIMVGILRRYGTKHKRTALNAKLYRLVGKGELVNIEKGVYALPGDCISNEIANE